MYKLLIYVTTGIVEEKSSYSEMKSFVNSLIFQQILVRFNLGNC